MKLILVVNAGLKMSKGKIAAQVGHASVSAALTARRRASHLLDSWLSGGQRKVCVKGRDADHLRELMAARRRRGSPRNGFGMLGGRRFPQVHSRSSRSDQMTGR